MTQIDAKIFNCLIGVQDSYQAPARLLEILYNKTEREHLMREVLKSTDYQVDDDTFRNYFEDEHADRKHKKQDFTPQSVSKLVRMLIGDTKESFYEGCAGTGSMTITAWNKDRMQHSPFDYKPSWYFYHVEELSDRAIPFLIFNLALRGMNAVVAHCDVLSRKAYGVFFIQNDIDDPMRFSSINRMPYSKQIEKEFGLKFVEERYSELIESPKDLPHLQHPTVKKVSPETILIYGLCGVDVIPKTQNEQPTAFEMVEEQLVLF